MSSMLNKLTGNSTTTNDNTTTSGSGLTSGSRTGATTGSGLGSESTSRAGYGTSSGSGITGSSTGYGVSGGSAIGGSGLSSTEEAREWATAHMEHDARVAFTGKSTTANVMSQNQSTNVEIPAQTMTATLPAKRVVVEVPERQVEVQLPARHIQLENQPEIEVRTHPTIRSVAASVVHKAEDAITGHHTATGTSGTSTIGSGRRDPATSNNY